MISNRTSAWLRDRTPSRRTARLGTVVAILALAVTLRGYGLVDDALWLDEVTTVVARANLPMDELIRRSIRETPHPPLYFVLLHLWFDLVGVSDWAARSFSAVAGVGAVLATYLVGRELVDHGTGTAAALFLAVAPFHVQHSRTARMYAVFSLFVCLSFYYFVLLADGRRSRIASAGYVVATTLVLYTHLYGVFVLAGQSLYVAVEFFRRNRPHDRVSLRLIGTQVAVYALFVPWLFLARDLLTGAVAGGGSGLVSWIPAPSADLLIETLLTYVGYVSSYPYATDDPFSWLVSLVLLALVVVLAFVAFVGYREEGFPDDLSGYLRRYRLVAFWLAAGLFLPYLVSVFVTPIFYPRFTMVALPAVFLLAAWGIRSLGRPSLRVVAVLVIVAGLLATTGVYFSTPSDEQWREAGAYIDEHAAEDATIFASPHFLDRPLNYYVDVPGAGARPLAPDANRSTVANGTADGRFWIVTAGGYAPANEAVANVTEGARLLTNGTFGEVEVALYRADPGE